MRVRLGKSGKGGGARSVFVYAQKINVDLFNKAGRRIAAAIKNEIQAGIRAITEKVSAEALERRERRSIAAGNEARKFGRWLSSAASGRKQRTRKHLGRGTYANDTGHLADKLRVTLVREFDVISVYLTEAPKDRLNPDDFGEDGKYLAFRLKLFELVRALHDPKWLWNRPKVRLAIEAATREQIKVEK